MHPRRVPKSELVWVGCAVCGRRPRDWGSFMGVVIDEESWTGADIFELSNAGGRFVVTEAFVRFVAAGKFLGVPLVPAEKTNPSERRRLPGSAVGSDRKQIPHNTGCSASRPEIRQGLGTALMANYRGGR